MSHPIVRVLIVDDSAYVRKVLRQMLSQSPLLEVVGAARDGEEALEMIEQLRPDVVTLDLMMPRMDGLAFLRAQRIQRPTPTVIISIAGETSEMALQALEEGAVDLIQKPTALATERMLEIREELIEKVKAAAGTRQPISSSRAETSRPRASERLSRPATGLVDVVVIGVSTGGPQALKALIPQLPAKLPVPVAMVLHIPEGYTHLYAKSLDAVAQLEVLEARDGMAFQPGRVLLAPGGLHLKCRRTANGEVVASLDRLPEETPHRPSVDVLFQSAAEAFHGRVLGVVLTGMGSDGTQGAAWIKSQGGAVLCEAEASCVVYGMPRSVVEAGLSDGVFPLSEMADAILERL